MLFRPVDHRLFTRHAEPADPTLRLRYLGTAGFVVESADRTVVIDPYLSRPGLLASGLMRLRPKPDLLRRYIPVADDVLVGHAHSDHVLDAPQLCRMTGARYIGGPSACNVARAAGVPEYRIISTWGREDIACGDVTVRGLPSLHGKATFGRIPIPGLIEEPPPWPARQWELRHGEVLNWHLEAGGLSIVHVDSADFIDDELRGLHADVVCLCAVGRRYRPRYLESIIELLEPRYIVPCHWDWFFSPYEDHPTLIPGVDLEGFIDDIRSAGVEPVVLPFEGSFALG